MAFPCRWTCSVALLAFSLLGSRPLRAEAPADPLLKLVPADAAVTLAVEDLRGHARTFSGSPIAQGLRALPSVRDWLASDRSRGLRSALKKAESVLGVNLATIRDDLLGEAVVLTLWVPKGGRPDEARGLLLARVPNRALLDRLVSGLNASLLKSGDLQRLSERNRGGTAYQVRDFRAQHRPRDYYAVLNDRVFAWSNSEDLIQGAIDRQSGSQSGLASRPEFRLIRDRLPAHPVASLYTDPRFLEGLATASPSAKSAKPGDDKAAALLARYLGAVRYAGVALEWRDGLILHSEEVVDPSTLPVEMKRWAARTDLPSAAFRRVPSTAILMATAHIDPPAIVDLFTGLASEHDRPKFENIRIALRGLLLGLDVHSDVMTRLGPAALVYVEASGGETPSRWFPMVGSIEVERGSKAGPALDNALRTILALHALDEKHGGGSLRVESRPAPGAPITTLNASTPFAYAVRDGRIDVGSSADAVARALAASNDPKASERVDGLRSAFFPDTPSFAAADLRAVRAFADPRREALAKALAERQHRSETDAGRDLDQVLSLINLFDAAFFTTKVAPDFTSVHHSLGLVRLPAHRP